MYWAERGTAENTKRLLDNSCSLGLFKVQDDSETKAGIGMARVITDYILFAFLTDVYVMAEHRMFGLGEWLIRCCWRSSGTYRTCVWRCSWRAASEYKTCTGES